MTDQSAAPLNDPVDSILTSKTLWANLLAPVFLWLGTKYGLQLTPEMQGYVIMVVIALMNVGLRRISSRAVAFTTPISK
jgi:hypothetical protein